MDKLEGQVKGRIDLLGREIYKPFGRHSALFPVALVSFSFLYFRFLIFKVEIIIVLDFMSL